MAKVKKGKWGQIVDGLVAAGWARRDANQYVAERVDAARERELDEIARELAPPLDKSSSSHH